MYTKDNTEYHGHGGGADTPLLPKMWKRDRRPTLTLAGSEY